MPTNPLDDIAANVAGLDLWQPRDWPHRRGDEIRFDLLEMPLGEDSPGRRPVNCENCGAGCLCIHDNVMCWKCKATFCLHCTAQDPSTLAFFPTKVVLGQGFGKCHSCDEPLRSLALVDVFRTGIEMNNSASADLTAMFSGSSLVQEAEDALKRGQECAKQDPEQAILEYTHAINAINYLASCTSGTRLILRAFDILLIAHSLRAQLEDNQTLYEAVVAAYPKASVRTASGTEQEWYLSQAAYKTLYYPLQANVMCGSRTQGGFVWLDQRAQSLDAAYASTEFAQQVAMAKYDMNFFSMTKNVSPHCDGGDPRFESLKGVWRGLLAHECQPNKGVVSCTIGGHIVAFVQIVQFVQVFLTDLAAAEDIRIQIETKDIGEETSLQATRAPHLEKMIRKNAKQFGVQDLQRLHVIKGSMPAISIVAAVSNASTKLFVHLMGDQAEQAACFLAAKAFAYLERQLKELRSPSRSSARLKVPYHHPDLSVCAYCGEGTEDAIKSCSRCKLARYCSVECQKRHWKMEGPFSHKPFCKRVVEENASSEGN